MTQDILGLYEATVDELPVEVQSHDGEIVQTTTGSYLSSSRPAAGFALIEAVLSGEAIQLTQHLIARKLSTRLCSRHQRPLPTSNRR